MNPCHAALMICIGLAASCSAPQPDPEPEVPEARIIIDQDRPVVWGENETDALYPGYEPKTTRDTVLDYAPQLKREYDRIPAPAVANFKALLATYSGAHSRAKYTPGYWTEGDVALGADPREYKPSPGELLAAEAGDRLRFVIENGDRQQLRAAYDDASFLESAFEYQTFTYRHADVMGSGRYFYASEPKTVRIPLRR